MFGYKVKKGLLIQLKQESRDFESNSALFYHLNFLPPIRRIPFFCLNKHYDAPSSVIYNLYAWGHKLFKFFVLHDRVVDRKLLNQYMWCFPKRRTQCIIANIEHQSWPLHWELRRVPVTPIYNF